MNQRFAIMLLAITLFLVNLLMQEGGSVDSIAQNAQNRTIEPSAKANEGEEASGFGGSKFAKLSDFYAETAEPVTPARRIVPVSVQRETRKRRIPIPSVGALPRKDLNLEE